MKLAKTLFCFENPPGVKYVSGSQDSIGIVMPGLNKLDYNGDFWPTKITSNLDSSILDWIEEHICLIPLYPRKADYDVYENTSINEKNARNLSIEKIGQLVDIVTIDVSFISQTLIMPNALSLLNDNGIYISLVKPQFEAGRANIGKGGIVKDKKARLLSVMRVIECAKALSFNCIYLIESPITGGDGNIEYLAVFSKSKKEIDIDSVKRLINK